MLTASLQVLPFDSFAAERYGIIRALLEKKGQLIGPMDLLIAAHASSINWTLVTNNLKEFKRVPDLNLENWAS
jgi:tRNA(fMet)-specific endonuclease VapC